MMPEVCEPYILLDRILSIKVFAPSLRRVSLVILRRKLYYIMIISAAFDTINHNVLLNRLQYMYGIIGTALNSSGHTMNRETTRFVVHKDGQ